MEDPRIISALFIFLKMAYYNVLINNKGFIGVLQIIVVTNDAKGLSVIKDIIINTIFTIQNIISAIILFTINVTPNLFFSKVNFLIF